MSIIGEAALSILLERLVGGLLNVSPNRGFFGKKDKTLEQINKWKDKLTDLRGLLRDAQEKRFANSAIAIWLNDLENLAYDVEDVWGYFNSEIKLRQQRGKWIIRLPWGHTSSAKLYSTLESITTRLEGIMARGKMLGLLQKNMIHANIYSTRHFEGPVVPETENVVFGRDKEKRDIIDFMMKSEQRVGVYPIVGMGGVGKTTIARFAYNYSYQEKFDEMAWVSVSKDYDRVRIYKSILSYVESSSTSVEDPGAIQKRVEEALKGKKFLIVLDDLWEINIQEWNSLQAPLLKGGEGSKIIVTTRGSDVAGIVRTVESYTILQVLSNEDCWNFFIRCACLRDNDKPKEYIGKKIVEKCCGLPLAVLLVGSLLRCKDDIEEWKYILQSELMNETKSVLKMSFDDLSYDAKNCFLCCVMFPEDWEFEEGAIIDIWFAIGLISCDQNDKYLIGSRCFRELVSRSLLLETEGGYRMHDLVREMGNDISGDKFCSWENKSRSIEKTRHLLVERSLFSEMVEMIRKVKNQVLPLRMIMIREDRMNPLILEKNKMFVMFQKLKNVRAVLLPCCNLSKLPDSLGEMMLLTYLDLSYWKELRTLPSTIGNLINLSYLDLSSCTRLTGLPRQIKNLANLFRVSLNSCDNLKSLPPEIGNLTNLCDIDMSGCKNLTRLPPEIGKLVNLTNLNLSNCWNL